MAFGFYSIDPTIVSRLGQQIKPELLANDARQKPAHRVRLPSSHLHHCNDRGAGSGSQQFEHSGLLGIAARRCRLRCGVWTRWLRTFGRFGLAACPRFNAVRFGFVHGIFEVLSDASRRTTSTLRATTALRGDP